MIRFLFKLTSLNSFSRASYPCHHWLWWDDVRTCVCRLCIRGNEVEELGSLMVVWLGKVQNYQNGDLDLLDLLANEVKVVRLQNCNWSHLRQFLTQNKIVWCSENDFQMASKQAKNDNIDCGVFEVTFELLVAVSTWRINQSLTNHMISPDISALSQSFWTINCPPTVGYPVSLTSCDENSVHNVAASIKVTAAEKFVCRF